MGEELGHVRLWVVLACLVVLGGGCVHFNKPVPMIPDVPNERQKTILDEYIIESPDLLQIDLLYAVPLPPYIIQPLDVLAITVTNTLEGEPITGLFPVEPDGMITLGGRYKSVKVAGLTLAEAKAAVQKHLEGILKEPKVTILALAEGRALQLVRGQHLVRPDGTVSLGSYGSVVVAQHTLLQAKLLIEEALKKFLLNPEVSVNVIGYNSKLYYIIFDFGGAGQQVVRLPVTGNDTVLDSISQVNGLAAVSDQKNIWVARSSGAGQPDQILPVDWKAITCRGRSETNYQLLPGDRIYVKAYSMTTADVTLARVLAPFERTLGFILLGASAYSGVYGAATGQISGGVP